MRGVGNLACHDPFSVAGRHIVVVGGTAGIGRAVAAHLVRAGAVVVVTGRRADDALGSTLGALAVAMDVADEPSVVTGFATIAEGLGHVDCLVLNAGIEEDAGMIDDLDLATFERVIDVNTLGLARAMAHGVRLIPEGGSVVVTSSPAGSVAAPGMAAYSASKAALDSLVRTWAYELGPRQVRVNAVLPGIVESEMASAGTPDEELIRRMTANGIVRRAEEMGPVFQFLAAEASAPLTGSFVGAHDGIPLGFSAEVLDRLGSDLA